MIGGFRRRLAVATVVCCLLTGLGGVALAGPVAAQDGTGDGEAARLTGFDEVDTVVAVQENGSATVTVEYRYVLDDGNESEREDWNELREDVESDPEAYTAAERARWQETAAAATNETERNMSIENVSVATGETTTPREYGHVEFTVEWNGFAHVELNRIVAGDALDGYVLDDGTSLTITWPSAYQVADVTPEPDDRGDNTVGWTGTETTFAEDEPRVELMGTNGAPLDEGADDGGLLAGVPTWGVALAALAALVGVAGVGWYVGRGVPDRTPGRREGPAPESGSEAATPPQSDPDPSPGPPPELLSNEERVLRLLERRGGRLKQQDVVSALEWTEAKTSQVVGNLRETDRIDVFRVGRENVLSLPPDEARADSPSARRDGAGDGGARPDENGDDR